MFMSKPLFRWTCGSCLPQGFEILAESVKRTTESLGVDRFDWMICYNGIDVKELDIVKEKNQNIPLVYVEQDWSNTPILDDVSWASPKKNGRIEWNGNHCGGTMWKVSPPRMRMESHEIVMDNDIIILKNIPQINYFLKSTNMALILEEPIRFYGRYNSILPENPFLNSGLMGFPPGYDFKSEIIRVWEENGSYKKLSQADEQGLLTYTLNLLPNIRIKKEQVKEVLARDLNVKITGDEIAVHFTQANRIAKHIAWNQYKSIKGLFF